MLVCPVIFMDTVVNGNHIIIADVVAMHYVGRCYALDVWQMLFPHNVEVLLGRWKATVAGAMALCV